MATVCVVTGRCLCNSQREWRGRAFETGWDPFALSSGQGTSRAFMSHFELRKWLIHLNAALEIWSDLCYVSCAVEEELTLTWPEQSKWVIANGVACM